MKQEYALKEYVSKNNYGKIINGSSSEILTNCNLTGDEAEAKIVALFGSIDLFKSCVQDMLDNHTRYFYHTEGGAGCKEINGLAWKNAGKYELDFLYEYWTSGIPYTKKVILQVADSNNTRTAIIEDISSDKSLEQKFTPSEKRLESNSDLNDYKTQGSWWESSIATLNTIANKPVGGVGEAVLQVFSCGNNYKLQVFYNITQNLVFIRAYQADHWTSWKDCSGNVTQDGDGIWSIRTNGNAQFQRVASVNGFFKESDKRLKSDIKPLTHTLDQICSIPTDSFTKSGIKQIGTIAQDLEKIIPEIVSEDYKLASEVPNKEEFEIIQHQNKDQVDDYIKVKKVEYDMLGVIAIEGIKLLKQEIDKLNNRIKELENGRDSDAEHD
jgi:hypothetical protein|nr:MAG TPA: endosialidase chaperone [Caudoviricetes sp.]